MSELENAVKNVELCRLCLKLTVAKINVFTEDFAKMIEILTSLKVTPDDSLPKVSCLKCARDVKSAFLVRRRIIQSYRVFNNKINRLGINTSSAVGMTTSEIINTISNTNLTNSTTTRPMQILKTIFDKRDSINNLESTVEDSDNDANKANCGDSDNSSDSDVSDNGHMKQISVSPHNGVENEIDRNIVKEPNGTSVQPQVETRSDTLLSDQNMPKIQSLKLDINMKYLGKIKSLENVQKLNAWKMMNKKDQVNILKWMEKKKVNTKNITTRLTSTTNKKREPMKMYCNHCQIKFNNKITFKNHMTRHKHKTCPVCDKQIRSTYLKKHMTLHEDAPVICEICGQTCKNPCSLRMHFFYYHKNPNFCVCEDCGRSFRTKTKLLYHQRKDHTKERNFKCETCGKSFFLKMYLTKHVNMKHMKLRPHICEYCGKGFSGKHALRTHVRQHTNEAPYQCNFCSERFRQRVSLRGHLKSRHKIEEENKVFCDSCGKGFASEVALDVHSRLHSEIKCPWCSDTFAEKDYLEQHVSSTHPNADSNMVEDAGFRWMNL